MLRKVVKSFVCEACQKCFDKQCESKRLFNLSQQIGTGLRRSILVSYHYQGQNMVRSDGVAQCTITHQLNSGNSWNLMVIMTNGKQSTCEEDETIGRSLCTLVRLTLSCILRY